MILNLEINPQSTISMWPKCTSRQPISESKGFFAQVKGGGRCVEEWIFAILIGEYLDMMNKIYRME